MKLADLLDAEYVELDATAASKEELIRLLVDRLARQGVVRNASAVVRALLDREEVMSTGVGEGVALPHAQSAAVKEFAVAFARPRQAIDFAALDGEPVEIVFLVVGPGDRAGLMRILTRISRLLYTGDLQRKIKKAKSPEEFVRLIGGEEAKLRK
jgi:fructose-specific phosphotransferase system IIA component